MLAEASELAELKLVAQAMSKAVKWGAGGLDCNRRHQAGNWGKWREGHRRSSINIGLYLRLHALRYDEASVCGFFLSTPYTRYGRRPGWGVLQG
jgi:hypothetical protein